MKRLAYLALGFAALLAASCAGDNGFYITDVEEPVVEVKNGNTIVLNSGLTVHIIGISPQNGDTYNYLKHNILGHYVRLLNDSYDDDEFYSFDDEIAAYVYDATANYDVNRKLLLVGGAPAFSGINLNDSLDAFKAIIDRHRNF